MRIMITIISLSILTNIFPYELLRLHANRLTHTVDASVNLLKSTNKISFATVFASYCNNLWTKHYIVKPLQVDRTLRVIKNVLGKEVA